MLGLDVGLSGLKEGHAHAAVKYSQHIANTGLGEFTAFANGFGGATVHSGNWRPEIGMTGGLELKW